MWNLLISRAEDPPGQFFDQRQIDAGELLLGSSKRACDIVLGTKADGVSGQHCKIISSGLDLLAVDNGSTNGVSLNSPDARITPHNPVPVREGDKLFICGFVVTIASDAMAAGLRMAPPPPENLPSGGGGMGEDDPFGSSDGGDWEEDPFWNSDSAGGDLHDMLSDEIGAHLGIDDSRPRDPGRDNFGDPIGMAMSRPILSDEPIAMDDLGIPEDWVPGDADAGSSDDMFGDISPPGEAATNEPVEDFFSDLGGPAEAPLDDDPFGDIPASNDPPAVFDDDDDDFGAVDALLDDDKPEEVDEPAQEASPPPPPPPPAATPTPAPAPAASSEPAQVAAGGAPDWSAFYEGAGMGPDEIRLSPDALRKLGVMYRQVVLGMSDLMRDRADFKDEFRVERTQLAIGRNNPLKHLPAQDAAKVLLGDPLPGFEDSEQAIRGAFEDLKRHQLAMLAGVQRAVQAVFDRLSPAEIEKLTEKAGAKKNLLSRRVNPWTVYATVFEALRKDATSNANGVMSVAFREGYEEYLNSAK